MGQTHNNNTPTNNAQTLRDLRINHDHAGEGITPERVEDWRDLASRLLSSLAVHEDPPDKVDQQQRVAAFDCIVAIDDALQSCDGRGLVKYITDATPDPHHQTNIQTGNTQHTTQCNMHNTYYTTHNT